MKLYKKIRQNVLILDGVFYEVQFECVIKTENNQGKSRVVETNKNQG